VRKWLVRIAAALGVLVIAIQLVPYGRSHKNPPVKSEPKWSSPEVRRIAVTSCFDCHSNETTWPWYSDVAPMSWLVQHDVDSGREALNFSEWGTGEQDVGDIVQVVREGEMPPTQYTLIHRGAGLSSTEKATLLRGLEKTFGSNSG